MKRTDSIQGLYQSLDQLTGELETIGENESAATLRHRLHAVAWTSSSELLEELLALLPALSQSAKTSWPPNIQRHANDLQHAIRTLLSSQH